MPAPRVYADFQKLDGDNRLRLTCAGTLQDLEREGIQLREGLVLTFYTDDADDRGQPDEMRADGVVQFNSEEQCWVAAIDWSAVRHASDEASGNGERQKSPSDHGLAAERRGAKH